jgi:hypothetical protein
MSMLIQIAPSGISEAALDVLRETLDLTLAIIRRGGDPGPAGANDRGYGGLLAAADKLLSPVPAVLERPSEREGLLKLLTLAEDVARHQARDRHPADTAPDRPDLELRDLHRRGRNVPLIPLMEAS